MMMETHVCYKNEDGVAKGIQHQANDIYSNHFATSIDGGHGKTRNMSRLQRAHLYMQGGTAAQRQELAIKEGVKELEDIGSKGRIHSSCIENAKQLLTMYERKRKSRSKTTKSKEMRCALIFIASARNGSLLMDDLVLTMNLNKPKFIKCLKIIKEVLEIKDMGLDNPTQKPTGLASLCSVLGLEYAMQLKCKEMFSKLCYEFEGKLTKTLLALAVWKVCKDENYDINEEVMLAYLNLGEPTFKNSLKLLNKLN
jgi:transcription initiation factor TFIIIB Brf1 subunit/transcription initiation factor TFIIB